MSRLSLSRVVAVLCLTAVLAAVPAAAQDVIGELVAMAASLRAGLRMGLSGFTYWSHDIGGFVNRPADDLYRRWAPFGALSSHTRAHGAPPREPWEYGPEVEEVYRRAIELKYRLMPYIYAQAVDASAKGYPMMRPLFFEYPEDPTSWLVEDEYLFGSDLLVAPLFESGNARDVYLPPGGWIDYQTGTTYEGGSWHTIDAGDVPVVLLVRSGAAIPHASLAQSTSEIDWNDISLTVYGDGPAAGLFAPPGGTLHQLRLEARNGSHVVADDPPRGEVSWRITRR